MIEPIFQSDNYLLARKLLDASLLRQEAIASNIANAETPGYRRIDVSNDFTSVLQAKLEAGTLRHDHRELTPSLVHDVHARSRRPDGNTVEIERELVEMNRNTLSHEFLTELVSRNIKQLKLAITGRPA